MNPQVRFPHEILSGIDDPLPPIKGFVLTEKKENPLVETLLTSPEPAGDREQHHPGHLDLRPGQGGRLYQRRRRRWTGDWVNRRII